MAEGLKRMGDNGIRTVGGKHFLRAQTPFPFPPISSDEQERYLDQNGTFAFPAYSRGIEV